MIAGHSEVLGQLMSKLEGLQEGVQFASCSPLQTVGFSKLLLSAVHEKLVVTLQAFGWRLRVSG